MAYAVSTSVFEGPFDLLLHLILREQVDLYEVSLAEIIDAYVQEITRLDDLDLDMATEFLLIAATLVELKTRRLLPGRDDGEIDEELALFEERDLLLARLLECKTFKDVATALDRLGDDAALRWPRRMGVDERYAALQPDLLAGVTPDDLCAAFLRASAPRPVPHVVTAHVAPIRASVADAVAQLLRVLPSERRVTFRRLTAATTERLEVIVCVLALLELCKQGVVELSQASRLGELHVAWLGEGEGGDLVASAAAAADAYDG
jgi:segregation and condensation protein A